jgi:hypothetical protein
MHATLCIRRVRCIAHDVYINSVMSTLYVYGVSVYFAVCMHILSDILLYCTRIMYVAVSACMHTSLAHAAVCRIILASLGSVGLERASERSCDSFDGTPGRNSVSPVLIVVSSRT